MYPVVNNSYQANQDALVQVCIWDQTPNKMGRVVMNNLRDPNFPAGNQYSFVTKSSVGLLMEMSNGGWMVPRRQGVTRIFVVLREGPHFNADAIEKHVQGKHFKI